MANIRVENMRGVDGLQTLCELQTLRELPTFVTQAMFVDVGNMRKSGEIITNHCCAAPKLLLYTGE